MKDQDKSMKGINGIMKKCYDIFRENEKEIVILLPFIVAICGAVSNYYFYLLNLGYYDYFGIDSRLMLPYNKVNLYKNIGQIALGALYWAYTFFTVRIFRLKGNILWKFITSIMIPFIINFVIVVIFNETINFPIIMSSIKYIPIHWILIYAFGYCMVISLHKEIPREANVNENNNKKFGGWGDIEFRFLGGFIVFIACIILFYSEYRDSYIKASNLSKFGIVKIDDEEYAVIDANETTLILQKCHIDNGNLEINIDTYLCMTNNVVINYKNFTTVELVRH